MPLTYTPLRYPGGKSKYARMLAEVISTNDLGGCTFVEAFAGGAGAAISLLHRGQVKRLVLNDLDIAIYAFWRSVVEHPSELITKIRKTPVTVNEWKKQRKIYEAKDGEDLLALGFATFFLNRANHSGILGARPIGGMSQNGKYKIDARFNKDTAVKKIAALASKCASIEVFNKDGLELLRHLRRRDENILLYLDPPYYQKGPALYLNHLEHENHRLLRDELVECDLPWVLSYDHHPKILDLYKQTGCSLYSKSIRHTVCGSSYAKELIVSNLQLPRELLATNNLEAI